MKKRYYVPFFRCIREQEWQSGPVCSCREEALEYLDRLQIYKSKIEVIHLPDEYPVRTYQETA